MVSQIGTWAFCYFCAALCSLTKVAGGDFTARSSSQKRV